MRGHHVTKQIVRELREGDRRHCCVSRCHRICGVVGCRWKGVVHAEGLSERFPR